MMANAKKRTWSLSEATNVDFDNYSKIVQKSEPRNPERENKPFLYPGPYARIIDPNNTKLSQKMQRGFMRSIIMDNSISGALKAENNPGNLRLNFQFNPEYIERRVSQSPGAVNPLLQNPQNLTQAVPGTAQFNFTMTFNREHEVAKSTQLNLIGTSDDFLNSDIEDNLKDPGKVGVMHDLSIFDKIIGQGISNELVDVITKYTQQQIVASNNEAADKATEGKTSDIVAFNETTFAQSINKNFGNSAFLNPMPVRIVFSDLFMVEGLVVSSAVAFQKFSQKMIPTICQVNCEVYALYVGFAKKKAFLTDNLVDWAKTTATDAAKNAENTEAAKIQMARRVKNVKFVMNSSDTVSAATDPENLEVPNYNSLSMRIVKPVITSNYYAGNVANDTDRFVTVPQWFNAFCGESFYPSTTSNVTNTYKAGYTSDQTNNNSNKVGKLPMHVFIEYEKLQGQGDELDAEFNLSVTLFESTSSSTKQISVEPEGTWVREGWTDYGIIRNSKASPATEIYRRVFWLDPQDVGIKETIASNARCTLNVVLTMRQNVAGVASQVVLDFKPIPLSYVANAPLYYKASSFTDNNKTLIKQISPSPNIPNPKTGGTPAGGKAR